MSSEERRARAGRGKGLGGSRLRPAVAVILLLLPFWAAPAVAGELSYSVWTWSQALRAQGEQTHPILGARIGFDYDLGAGWHAVGRADISSTQDGAAPTFDDPATFQTLEAYAGIQRAILPAVAVAVVGGAVVDLQTTSADPNRPYPKTWGVGAAIAMPAGGWCYGLVGKHGAAGDGWKGLVTCQQPVGGPMSLVGDAVMGTGSFYRVGVAVRVK